MVLASCVHSLYYARPFKSLPRSDIEALKTQEIIMKPEIHPEYSAIAVTCSCGNTFETKSTLCKDLSVEVCSKCHPFYTGKQKMLDTGGRVDRFRKRYGKK